MSGAILPGEALKQNYIARRLGVSSTPVREALRRLQTEGLVTHAENRGVTVSELSADDIEELYMLRAAMEGVAARLAARRRTENDLRVLEAILVETERLEFTPDNGASFAQLSRRFHDAVARAGSPEIVAPRIHQLWIAHPVPGTQSIWNDPDAARALTRVHREIFEALRSGDETTVVGLMVDHIEGAGTRRLEAEIRRDGHQVGRRT